MLGVYDYTVILTYASLASSLFGILNAIEGSFPVSMVCLLLSGLLDGFDGKVARTKKNRTEDEKCFGIQIDSLCDVICFGVFPAILCYQLGMNSIVGKVLVIFYCIAAVARLAFFNVSEQNRQKKTTETRSSYRGLPVTTASIVYPFFYLIIGSIVSAQALLVLLYVVTVVLGFLFITDVPIHKPTARQLYVLVGALAVLYGIGIYLKFFF